MHFFPKCVFWFQVYPRKQENGFYDSDTDVSRAPIKLRTYVELAMDVSSASPRRYFFEAMILSLWFDWIICIRFIILFVLLVKDVFAGSYEVM